MGNQFYCDWPDEKTARLRDMAAKKYQASVIAAELGTTRNAIIGKMRRLGIKNYHENNAMEWNETQVSRLRELCEQRVLAAVIGAEFGCNRRSIIAKMKRLGIPYYEPTNAGGIMHGIKSKSKKTAPVHIDVPVNEKSPVRLSVYELEHGECRWPIDYEDKVAFCGAAVRIKMGPNGRPTQQSYCPFHAARSYVPV